MTVGPDLKARAGHRLSGPCSPVERHDQLAAQALPGHLQDVGEANLAGGQLQEGPRAAVQIQDVALAVDQGSRRAGLLQEGLLRQLPQLVPHGVGRLAGCLGQGGVNRRHGGAEGAEGRPSAAANVLLALVQLGLAVHDTEQIGMVAHGLRGAQEEHATGVQGVVKQREELLLQVAAQVDHEVAAADEIQPGEGRILDHVLLGEDHRVPDALVDPVAPAAGLGHEKPRQPFRREVNGDAGRIEPRPGRGHCSAVDVRGEHLQSEALLHELHALLQQDGEGVGLLAGGAARAPDPDHRACRLVGEEAGEGQVFEGLERRRVPEEVGDADEQIPEERLHLHRRLLQVAHIGLDGVDLMHGHAALDAAVDGAGLVLGEVVAGLGAQQDEDLLQRIFQLGGWDGGRAGVGLAEGVGRISHQLGGHLGGRQHEVHQARGQGTLRHAGELGGLGGLGHHHAALALDGPDAQGAVAAGAREHDADGPLALVLGQGAEEEVDGQALAARRRRLQQLQGAVQEGHVPARRDDVGAVGLDHHPVLHLKDAHAGVAPDELRQEALVIRGQVLDQHKGHAGIRLGGHAREEGFKSPQATRRGADAHDGEGRRGLPHWGVGCDLLHRRGIGHCWRGGCQGLGRAFGLGFRSSGHGAPLLWEACA